MEDPFLQISNEKETSVPSLVDLCVQVLQRNTKDIMVTTKVPRELIHRILRHCTPDQLEQFEDDNFDFVSPDDTEDLWKRLCIKRLSCKKKPDDETWRELFFRKKEEQNKRKEAAAAKLKSNYDKINAKKSGRKAQTISNNFVNSRRRDQSSSSNVGGRSTSSARQNRSNNTTGRTKFMQRLMNKVENRVSIKRKRPSVNNSNKQRRLG
eukprot:gb/GECH01007202.1/.p1 GENE.gb/GECH01007202.1/~~gb/GECH01007202.1/.p1  ORF type:complete len:209 (+),score=54.28 gb/GECH01007202.1/:1-627(+)